MITWLQTILIKHNKILFSALLVVVIVTFILMTGSGNPFGSQPSGMPSEINYFDYNLASEGTRQAIMLDAQMSMQAQPMFGYTPEMSQTYPFLRAAALGLANRWGLPEPSNEAVEDFIRNLNRFRNPNTQSFDADQYTRFMDSLKTNPRTSVEHFLRVIKEDVLIDQVVTIMETPGFAIPFESIQSYRESETQWEVINARMEYDVFDVVIEPTESELEEYYKQNPAKYERPEQIKVTGVAFDYDDFIDQVPEPTEDQIVLYFERNRSKYQKIFEEEMSDTDPIPGSSFVTLDLVRNQAIADWKLDRARRQAEAQAEEFTLRLWEQKIARNDPRLLDTVEELNGAFVQLVPYSRQTNLGFEGISDNLLQSMWAFAGSERYFSEISRTDTGAIVLLFDEIIPARLPEVSEVLELVHASYIEDKKRELFSEAAEVRQEQLVRLVNRGESFEEAAGQFDLEIEPHGPFAGNSVPSALRRPEIWNVVRVLEEGDISPPIISNFDGHIIYVKSKEEPTEEITEEALAEYQSPRQRFYASGSGWSLLNAIASQRLAEIGLVE